MNLFLDGKNMLILMVSILINKDVFEPSYNDLKFTVQICNYICTNQISSTRKQLFHLVCLPKYSIELCPVTHNLVLLSIRCAMTIVEALW